MAVELIPDTDEVRQWLLDTVRHSYQVEYYLHNLGINCEDPQRPHDIIGPGNKFEWEVMKGLALQNRSDDPEFFETYVRPCIEMHRQQYHHQAWNFPNDHATDEDMKLGAIDAICSHLDDRPYQGGTHSFEQIVSIIKEGEPHKVKWMWMVFTPMRQLPGYDLDKIKSLHNIPNHEIPGYMHRRIVERVEETVEMLEREHGYHEL